ncbi:hypothetical protein ACFLTM_05970, partial [Candidatus Bipolaricaulota bacterium]
PDSTHPVPRGRNVAKIKVSSTGESVDVYVDGVFKKRVSHGDAPRKSEISVGYGQTVSVRAVEGRSAVGAVQFGKRK